MTAATEAAAAIHFALVLFLLWVLIFWMWPSLRLDMFRERLFNTREELFMYWAGLVERGVVRFDDPAYTMLRTRMNGMLRFAHRVTLPRLVLTMVEIDLNSRAKPGHSFQAWLETIEKLPEPEIRSALVRFHARMLHEMARHLLWTSPTLMLFTAFYGTKVLVTGAAKRFWDKFARRLRVELLEDQAVIALEEDQRAVAGAS